MIETDKPGWHRAGIFLSEKRRRRKLRHESIHDGDHQSRTVAATRFQSGSTGLTSQVTIANFSCLY